MFNNINYTNNNDFLGSNAPVETVGSAFDYNSFYRAIVKSNYDPEGLGRIKISIPALHSTISNNNQFPWAYPACFVGLGNQVGQFILPPVGSVVFVTFEYSDEHRPIYFGGIPTKFAEGKTQAYGFRINDGEPKQVTTDDIPSEYNGSQAIVYKSPSGAIIYFDDYSNGKKVIMRDSVGQEVSQKTWTTKDGVVHKKTTLSVDDANNVVIEPDKLILTISGVSKTIDKEILLNLGLKDAADTELISWD